MPDVKPTIVSVDDAQNYEDTHVHAVYDEIAPHFSSTRYKPWPIIAAFLSSIPTGSVGVDLGTGNGKYLPLPLDRSGSIWTVGLDRSINLLKLAKHAGEAEREVVWGDVLDNPWRAGVFDYATSIATIHHLATPARRKLAVQRLLQCISPSHGRGLIYVWAIEQDELSKRNIPTGADELVPASTSAIQGQDVFVPWVLSQIPEAKSKTRRKGRPQQVEVLVQPASSELAAPPPKVFDRYYHMFAKGELSELVTDAAVEMGLVVGSHDDVSSVADGRKVNGLQIVQDGWERSNYYVELRRWAK